METDRYATLDWLSFTVARGVGDDLLALFGDAYSIRVARGGDVLGALGYSISARLPQGGMACWGGNGGGMHFVLPAGCLGWLAGDVGIERFVRAAVESGGTTRLDVAVDDHTGAFSVGDVIEAWDCGEVVSRYSVAHEVRGHSRGDAVGHTFYIGSQHSDSRVRVYDKRAESGGAPCDGPWVRVEFQARGPVAVAILPLILRGEMSELLGVVSGYVQWRVPSGDSNVSRWAVHPAWESVLGAMRRGLGLPGPTRTLGRSMGWIADGMGTTLMAIRDVLGPVAFVQWWREGVLGGADPGRVKEKRLSWGCV